MAGPEAAGAAAAAAAEGSEAGNGDRDGYDGKCVFCRIARREEPGTALLPCEDEDLVCFRDIKPGAPHHYLVVPVKHMGNCKTLKTEHIPLVKRMMEVGKAVLQKNNFSDLNDVSPLASARPGPSQPAGVLIQDLLQNQFLLVYHG
ncbi:histidine triad nucleotide-binding protein 3 isoform X2 [Camarhynchus parvulus]|uniref:histidine triad nucleotide-binding protein 3 isoform X2 n=1 Tax=Geospiza parvula TaxID=87175 RepID=UPI001237FA9B|nr:histidine triad nucleotide-binding protein 3 isoform X2 [Camarhynchus parvulus]